MFKRKKQHIVLSAKFKKDYITFLAISIFVIMIFSELIVAISIPVVVKYSNIYAEEGVRHNLIQSFDETRSNCIALADRSLNPEVKRDLTFILDDLNRIALELRSKQVNMTIENAEELLGYVESYNKLIHEIYFNNNDQSFLRKVEVAYDDTIYKLVEDIDNTKLPKTKTKVNDNE